MSTPSTVSLVIPAQAGIQTSKWSSLIDWIPAFAGMTDSKRRQK